MQPEERFERIERQMELLANQQADLFASIQSHDQQIERHQQQIERHSEQIADLGSFLLRTARLLEDQARRTDERFNLLAEIQRHTDERLDRLAERLDIVIGVVERYFSNGGRP